MVVAGTVAADGVGAVLAPVAAALVVLVAVLPVVAAQVVAGSNGDLDDLSDSGKAYR